MKKMSITLCAAAAGSLLVILSGNAIAQDEPVSQFVTQGKPLGRYYPPTNEALARLEEAQKSTERGNALLKQGDHNGAIKAFRDAIALERSSDAAYEGFVTALTAKGDYAEAIGVYREVVYQWPGKNWWSSRGQDTDFLMGFALLLSKMGQYEEAISVYNQGVNRMSDERDRPLLAIGFHPKSFNKRLFEAAAHVARGRTNRDVDNHSDAEIAEYKKAAAIKPDLAQTYYFWGNALRAKGDQDTASLLHVKALKMAKGSMTLKIQKALSR